MWIGGFLLGAIVGALFGFFVDGPLSLLGRFGYVIPVLFGVAGAYGVKRLPRRGRIAVGATGFLAAGAVVVLGVAIFAVFCWFVWTSLVNRHGWF
jgi:hypothetical protein